MKIGFLNNQIDNRGTGNAMFDYAHYNEEILGNKAFIYTFSSGTHDELAIDKYTKRFGQIRPFWDIPADKLDVLYHIKSGVPDGVLPPTGVKYAVHAVFDYEPHGDRYAVVSYWLAQTHRAVYVPHIISLPQTDINLRGFLSIPDDHTIFGRHGGADTFDIPFVWDSIGYTLANSPNTHFLFMNTNMPTYMREHPRVHIVQPTSDAIQKRVFINTCDAMIHARQRGETFGIAIGEFAICGKPIITYGDSPEKAHLLELPYAEQYTTQEELTEILLGFSKYKVYGYKDFTPEKVMQKFKEVFLD